VDATGSVFVTESVDNTVTEIAFHNGSYAAPMSLGSGFSSPTGVAVDANGSVYVADTQNSAVEQFPFSNGSYGAPLSLGSGITRPAAVAVDSQGRLYVIGYAAGMGRLWIFAP
jgi:sugar lactone lactonase YvrE